MAGRWSVFGRITTPGLFKNHSFMARGVYQMIQNGDKTFALHQKELYPRGASVRRAQHYYSYKEYYAMAFDYQLPVAYPDWGVPGIIFVKRIRFNMIFDYARYKSPYASVGGVVQSKWFDLNSYGGEFIFDVNFMRQPSSGTSSIKLSLFKPSNRGVRFYAGLALPL